jgi:hypothetical protein
VRKWLRQQSKDFYAAGFSTLSKWWDKCINVGGGYVEKYTFSQVRISYFLRFISIYDLFTDSPSYYLACFIQNRRIIPTIHMVHNLFSHYITCLTIFY